MVGFADLAQRHMGASQQIYAWKQRFLEQAARAFEPDAGRDADPRRGPEIEKLHPKSRQLIVESDCLSSQKVRNAAVSLERCDLLSR